MTYEYFFVKNPPRRDSYPHSNYLIGTNTFTMKTYIRQIGQDAYGTVYYKAPLTNEQMQRYGLMKGRRW